MKKIFLVAIALLLPSVVSAATLSVSPSSQSVKVGDTFSVVVSLDTQGTFIDGVDFRYINYNPAVLQVQDSSASSGGVQIAPGVLMSMTLANNVDTNLGRITFSQVASGGNKYKGSGTLATITFKALSAGTANLTFNHTSGNTTDSNVAANGSDVLTAVINGSYTVNGASSGGSTTSGGDGSSSSGGSSTGGVVAVGPTACVPGAVVSSLALARNLYRSLKGEDVKALQNFLVSKGYLTADSVTSFFGPLTEAAVQKFQKAENIVSAGTPLTTGYGSVGPTTRGRINSLLGTSSCSSSQGSSGSATVQSLQEQIKLLQAQVNALLLKLQQMR